VEGQVEDPQKTLKWTRQTIDLLGQLQERLSETIEAWEGFNSSDGDIGYFSDIDCSPDAQQRRNCNESIAAIKETFEILRNLQRRLVLLEKTCQNLAKAVSTVVPLFTFFIQKQSLTDSYSFNFCSFRKVAKQRGTMLSPQSSQVWLVPHECHLFSFTANSIQLSPLALAATIFNIPQTVMPFPMTFKSLTIVVFIIVIVSFGALSLFRRRRKRTIPWMNAMPLDGTTRPLWTSGRGWRLGSREGRSHLVSSLEDV
jgi:hypothetical protein